MNANSPPPVRIKLLSPRAAAPRYQTDLAAGFDLAACLPEGEHVTIAPRQIAIIPCGLAVAIPKGYEGQVRPRSGLASKFGITLPNAPGTIDADYRGEVKVPLINHGCEPYVVEHGTRIAQMVIAPILHADLQVVEELDDTSRGAGGFGSTGGH
jgi:dUTP pyrophosphatase